MTKKQLRNKDLQQPGNGGQWAAHTHSDPDPDLDFDLGALSVETGEQVAVAASLAATLLVARAQLAESGALNPEHGGMDIDRIDHRTIAAFDTAAATAMDMGLPLPFEHREQLMLATHPATAEATLHALAIQDEPNWLIINAIASHENAPAEALRIAAGWGDRMIRARAAAHFNTPVDVLTELAQDEMRDVRATVAANELTPTSVLETLIYDEDPQVQLAIAHRSTVDPALLGRLSDATRFEVVRETVAKSHLLAG